MRTILTAFLIAATAPNAAAKNFYLPIAGSVPGVGNTYSRTDIRIFNPSYTTDVDVSIHFLPQGQDNSSISGQLFKVPRRQMLVVNDIVGSLIGWTPPLIGALRADSDAASDYNILVDSRTYTDSPNPAAPGTFGQFIPALDVKTAIRKSIVVHASSTADFRTNGVVMNPQRVPATVTASLAFPDGSLVAPETTITVPPMSMIMFSVPVLFGTQRTFADAFLHFDSDQPVFTGVSVVDNRSSDSFCVPGLEDKDEVRPLP